MRTRRAAPLAALALIPALVPALVLAGCGIASGQTSSIAHQDALVIGVKPDQPGLGFRLSGDTYEGFDVDVATYVAGKLGAKVSFKPTTSNIREQALQDGTVDLIFATYSITPERRTKITFGGPYYVAHQDTAVRPNDESIKNVRDLKDKRLCQVTGSNSWKRVVEEKKIAARLVETDSYSACFTMLTRNEVDAVSTDDLILAGFARGISLKIVNAPFTDEKYGIGIKKGDLDGCEAVNKAVTEMYQDGTAAALLTKWFGKSGLQLTTSVPQFEGCT
jgi:glutamate transport system substrate-binding protein